MERKYLMVRAMTSQEIHFKEFFDNSIVAVGWSNIDFSKIDDTDELKEKVRAEYYSSKSGPLVGKNLNECVRFKRICRGDYIIIPYYSGIALAKAEEGELYSDSGKKIDLANQHKVTYLYKDGAVMSVPRNNLSEGLQRRLRVPGMSVSDLSEFSDEIEKLFEKPESYSFSDEARIKEDEMQKEFKSKLLSNIQYGKTNLQTGGIGMENLIKELFECEGYEAKILAKTTFKNSADADIEAWRDDAFLPTRKIYAQVKHHSGTSGSTGIDQVIGAIKDKNDDYFGVFITSANVSDEDRKYAEANNIIVKDGNDVVDLIFSNLDKLSIDTKRKLGIVMVPSVII